MLLIFAEKAQGQELSVEYTSFLRLADSCYFARNYSASAKFYSQAFQSTDNKATVIDRYNAACSWALAGNADSAFVQLFRITKKGRFCEDVQLIKDKDLISLHLDHRWQELLLLVKANNTN